VNGPGQAPDDGGYFAGSPRPLGPHDAVAARALVYAALGVTPYVDRVVELLDQAARGGDPEARALVIERDGTIAGLVIFGLVAGASGAARLHALVLDRGVSADDVGGRLTSAAATAAASAGARLLVAEVPDDPALGQVPAVLLRNGFREEARVPDFFRDGVALTFLRRELTSR
jgi:ribosomal protein S18 acetylase RimI-like enzyme